MKKKNNSLALIWAVFLLFPHLGFSQNSFHYSSQLPPVDSSGFYKIELNPSIIAKTHHEISDIRILGPEGKMVSFLYAKDIPSRASQTFLEFPAYRPDLNPDSVFIFENTHQYLVRQWIIRFRNTQVNRIFSISGSDNLKTWYALLENIALEDTPNEYKTSGFSEQKIQIPYSGYHYYKITVHNGKHNPLGVIGSGIYLYNFPKSPQFEKVPIRDLFQKDSAGTTQIKIHFQEPYQIHQIRYQITEPSLYLRKVSIYSMIGKTRNFLMDTVLKSGAPPTLNINTQSGEIDLEVENGDNPSLQFKSLEAFQKEESLVALLEKGKKYKLVFGDSLLPKPRYDLAYFTDSLNHSLALVFPESPKPIEMKKEVKNPGGSIPQYFIWVSLILVLILLVALTFSLTKEIEKRKTE